MLVGRARDGNQDASTQLYLRYAGRVTALVKRRCSSELARCAGVEDIVQSVFGSFFQRTGQGHYDFTDCDGMWRMLLVISINRIRTLATYHYAAKRDRHRTIFGARAHRDLESKCDHREFSSAFSKVILQETLERLPSRDRMLVRLRLDGFTIAEVAQIAGRSTRTVERIIQSARPVLTELVQN